MSNDLREDLKELVAKWRENRHKPECNEPCWNCGKCEAADELDAILAKHAEPECGCEEERCFGPMTGYKCRAEVEGRPFSERYRTKDVKTMKHVPPKTKEIIGEICRACFLLGAKSDLLGTIGSWGDSLPDSTVLADLRAWNDATERVPPRQRDSEENLADYLLRNRPPTWDYETVLQLARAVAEGQKGSA